MERQQKIPRHPRQKRIRPRLQTTPALIRKTIKIQNQPTPHSLRLPHPTRIRLHLNLIIFLHSTVITQITYITILPWIRYAMASSPAPTESASTAPSNKNCNECTIQHRLHRSRIAESLAIPTLSPAGHHQLSGRVHHPGQKHRRPA